MRLLPDDFTNALSAYQQCLATSTSPDNVVSASNWLYMISQRMDDETAANVYMEGIDADMKIIKNFNYHYIDLFYKGKMSLEELSAKAEEPDSGADAINYAIGNWYVYNGEKDKFCFYLIYNNGFPILKSLSRCASDFPNTPSHSEDWLCESNVSWNLSF